jgi:hypothetical protein
MGRGNAGAAIGQSGRTSTPGKCVRLMKTAAASDGRLYVLAEQLDRRVIDPGRS